MFPILGTFAAFQDWDAVYAFDYGRYGSTEGTSTNQMQGYFGISRNPAKESFLPFWAALLRSDSFAPATGAEVLHVTQKTLVSGDNTSDVWTHSKENVTRDMFKRRIALAVAPVATADYVAHPGIARPDTSAIDIVRTTAGPHYLAVGTGAAAIAGFIGGLTTMAGPLSIATPQFGDNFAAVTVAACDRRPLTSSRRILLTIVGKAENLDMQWNAAHNSVGWHWGHGPAQAEGIPATITLSNPVIKHVWALDPTGARTTEVPVTATNGKAQFTVGPEYRTVWYELGE